MILTGVFTGIYFTGEKKPYKTVSSIWLSLLLVPRRGLEPPRPCEHQHLKLACLPISPPGQGMIERYRGAKYKSALRACQRENALVYVLVNEIRTHFLTLTHCQLATFRRWSNLAVLSCRKSHRMSAA